MEYEIEVLSGYRARAAQLADTWRRAYVEAKLREGFCDGRECPALHRKAQREAARIAKHIERLEALL